MRTPRVIALALAGLIFAGGLGVVLLVLAAPPAPLVMTIRGYQTNQCATPTGNRDCVSAVIELTNRSNRSFSFWGWVSGPDQHNHVFIFPAYTYLYPTQTGWKHATDVFNSSPGVEQLSLMPSQSITFQALVKPDRPCKVTLDYSGSRLPSRLLRYLPNGLAERLPWTLRHRTVTTDEINLTVIKP